MKLCLILLTAAVACLLAARLFGQSTSPVSVEIISPTNGQVISNTVTITATASSSAAPIHKVEFFKDGVLMGTVYRHPMNPTGLKITRP